MQAKPPTNKKELQRLLGQINFLKRFISNVEGRTKAFSPLLKLKSNEEFVWGQEQQEAFEAIKEYLVIPPVLTPPKRVKRKRKSLPLGRPTGPAAWGREKTLCFLKSSSTIHARVSLASFSKNPKLGKDF